MATTCGSVLRVISLPTGPNDRSKSKLLTLALWNPRCGKKFDYKLSELQLPNLVKRKGLFCLRVPNCSSGSMPSKPHHLSSYTAAKRGQEVALLLNGRSAFLVGMMGSGKTTVAEILSKALGYSFVDSDRCVEEAQGGTTVKEIFEKMGENKFRYYETKELEKLSMIPKHVVATGGGAVTTPINWEYMQQGITVFLDVPLDVLAKRLAADNGDRPLLKLNSRDPNKVYVALRTVMEERGEYYTNTKIKVSLEQLAAKLEIKDASKISAKTIALQVLVQIEQFLKGQNSGVDVKKKKKTTAKQAVFRSFSG